jgi:plastocyanin
MLSSTRPRPYRLGATVIASSLFVVLAACGSDKESSSETTAAAAATTAAGATPTTAAAPTTEAAATTAAAAATTEAAAATTAAGAATTEAGAASSTPAAEGTVVAVDENEFNILLPEPTLTAGTYTFDITNSGKFKHNLIVTGNGQEATSDTYEGGQTGTLTVTLTPGTYEFYCGIPTHKEKGMTIPVTVT